MITERYIVRLHHQKEFDNDFAGWPNSIETKISMRIN